MAEEEFTQVKVTSVVGDGSSDARDGIGTAAAIKELYDVCEMADGSLLLTDVGAHRIVRYFRVSNKLKATWRDIIAAALAVEIPILALCSEIMEYAVADGTTLFSRYLHNCLMRRPVCVWIRSTQQTVIIFVKPNLFDTAACVGAAADVVRSDVDYRYRYSA